MKREVQQIIILGGGTAGWLAACVLAARLPWLEITLVEAPDVPTIGVGEGTWPTMRSTLAQIGISEQEFLAHCGASFKQGSRFNGWVTGDSDDTYLHPFTPPPHARMAGLLHAWKDASPELSFAQAMTPQARICSQNLAPRQRQMPDFAASANYAYHLDAGKFAALLASHATKRLGVRRIAAHVTQAAMAPSGDIAALQTREGVRIAGDLFLDCSGQAALLIGKQLNVGWTDCSQYSFNDRALAMQIPVTADSAIASQTNATAHEAGWIWDIALPSRRGIGCVYSAKYMEDDRAEQVLRNYLAQAVPQGDFSQQSARKLAFPTGHREAFWQRNCLAIGMSAGFIEPLEASAIVLIELSLRALADNFPASRAAMDIHARRFNTLFLYRWERIIDFLKLHYVLSQRQEPYWQDQRDPVSIPDRLKEQLALWRDQPPSQWDFPQVDEIFSAASQQYVLYGMGFPVPDAGCGTPPQDALAGIAEVRERGRALSAALPSNRTYFDQFKAADNKHQAASATTH